MHVLLNLNTNVRFLFARVASFGNYRKLNNGNQLLPKLKKQ